MADGQADAAGRPETRGLSVTTGGYHRQRPNLVRALGPLPFRSSPDLEALVKVCYPAPDAPSARARPVNDYALMPDTLDFLAALLAQRTPELVVEFGSGASTRLFVEWCVAHGARVISVEHDRSWAADLQAQLTPPERRAVTILHAPLRPTWQGLRQFLTYRGIDRLAADIAPAGLFLVDGPHVSGREPVLYFVLSHCRPGTVIVIDDFRLYSVREMLMGVPPTLASCFAGVALPENSHGLYVLQCIKKPPATEPPLLGVLPILRSYWRCLRDFRTYGTGD